MELRIARNRPCPGSERLRRLRHDLLRSAAAAVLVALAGGGALAASPSDVVPVAQATLDAAIRSSTIPGGSAGIRFADGTTWLGASGDSTVTVPRSAMQPSLQMRIASQTKSYTGTVVLQMVGEGLVNLNDTVQRWLPYLNVPNASQITVRNLLNMTSGIPDYLNAPVPNQPNPNYTLIQEWNNYGGQVNWYTPDNLVQVTNGMPRTSAPGAAMNYSNTNFVLLALIAQQASCNSPTGCASFTAELSRRVLSRLPIPNTYFPANSQFTGAYSNGYDQTYRSFTNVDPAVPWAAGAMISNPIDELVWVRQLTTNNYGLLTPAVQAQRIAFPSMMGSIAGVPVFYALGVYYLPSPMDGSMSLGHGGEITGYSSALYRRMDLGIDYAVNVNQNPRGGYPAAMPDFGTGLKSMNFYNANVIFALLDRTVTTALASTGTCGFGSPSSIGPGSSVTCSGDSVRTSALTANHAVLVMQPSGKTIPGIDYLAMMQGGNPFITTPLPTLSVYGNGISGIILTNQSALVLQPGAIVEIMGVGSTAVEMQGSGNILNNAGTINAWGPGTVAIRTTQGGNAIILTNTSIINGSIVLTGNNNVLRNDGVIMGSVTGTRRGLRLSGAGTEMGTVGGVRLAPGNSIGTMVVGGLTGTDTTLEIETGDNGRADLLVDTGTADLNGAALEVSAAEGVRDSVYPILIANRVTGTFSSITTGTREAAVVDYGQNLVRLATVSPVLQDAAVRMNLAGENRQLELIGRRLGRVAAGPTAGTAQAALSFADASRNMDPTRVSDSADFIAFFDSLAQQPINRTLGNGFGTWADGYYERGKFASNDGVDPFDTTAAGGVAGIDWSSGDGLTVGAALGFQHSTGDVKGRTDSVQTNAYYGSLYAAQAFAPYFVDATVLLGGGSNDVSRTQFNGGAILGAKGSYDDFRVATRLGAGAAFRFEGAVISPVISASYLHLNQDGYTETGAGALNLSVASRSASAWRFEGGVGVALPAEVSFGSTSGIVVPQVRLGLAHDLVVGGRTADAAFASFGGPFQIQGFNHDVTSLMAGASLDLQLDDGLAVYAGYDGNYSSGEQIHRVSGGLRLVW